MEETQMLKTGFGRMNWDEASKKPKKKTLEIVIKMLTALEIFDIDKITGMISQIYINGNMAEYVSKRGANKCEYTRIIKLMNHIINLIKKNY